MPWTPPIFEMAPMVLTSVVGKILLTLWVFSLYLHMSNGIRHLFWDLGYGFGGNSPLISSLVVLAATILMTIITVLIYLF